jgi:flavin reductase (DIM6/NTAB) family NADH-FMN oxidoreductase RutF
MNSIVAPRPIGWVSTQGSQGRRNLAPYSFCNLFNYRPPIFGFCSIGAKDSLRNVRETGVFVWNLATIDLAEQMNASSVEAPYEVDEFELTGLTPLAGAVVAAPRVAESPVHMECKLCDIVTLKSHTGAPLESWLVLGEVVGVHIDRRLLKDGVFDTFGAGIILRAGGPLDYAVIRPDAAFQMQRPKRMAP